MLNFVHFASNAQLVLAQADVDLQSQDFETDTPANRSTLCFELIGFKIFGFFRYHF